MDVIEGHELCPYCQQAKLTLQISKVYTKKNSNRGLGKQSRDTYIYSIRKIS
jgi:hypothetical protein